MFFTLRTQVSPFLSQPFFTADQACLIAEVSPAPAFMRSLATRLNTVCAADGRDLTPSGRSAFESHILPTLPSRFVSMTRTARPAPLSTALTSLIRRERRILGMDGI